MLQEDDGTKPPVKREIPADLFEMLDNGLRKMFRTCAARENKRAVTRQAGADVANALLKLHGHYKPK